MAMTPEDKLHRLLDDIFTAADERRIGLSRLACLAQLRRRTVERLSTYQTKLPRLKTIYALAIAVGYDLNLVALKETKHGYRARQSA